MKNTAVVTVNVFDHEVMKQALSDTEQSKSLEEMSVEHTIYMVRIRFCNWLKSTTQEI